MKDCSEYELFSTKTDGVIFLADSLLSACFFYHYLHSLKNNMPKKSI